MKMDRAMLFFFISLALTFASPFSALAGCQTEAQARADATEAGGIVTSLSGDLAQQIARLMWRAAGREPPMVDSLLVVARKDGTISVVPVTQGLVCVTVLNSTEDKLSKALAQYRAVNLP